MTLPVNLDIAHSREEFFQALDRERQARAEVVAAEPGSKARDKAIRLLASREADTDRSAEAAFPDPTNFFVVAGGRDDEPARFARLFTQAPSFMGYLRGPTHVIEFANPNYLKLVGHRPVVGKTLAEALPDAAKQGLSRIA